MKRRNFKPNCTVWAVVEKDGKHRLVSYPASREPYYRNFSRTADGECYRFATARNAFGQDRVPVDRDHLPFPSESPEAAIAKWRQRIRDAVQYCKDRIKERAKELESEHLNLLETEELLKVEIRIPRKRGKAEP